MKKIIVATFFLFFAMSCAHHHAKNAHHHHVCDDKCPKDHATNQDTFQHKCATSIMEGDAHIEGKEDYKISHAGHIYYFSSEDKMKKFEQNLEKNIQVANQAWVKQGHDHDGHDKK